MSYQLGVMCTAYEGSETLVLPRKYPIVFHDKVLSYSPAKIVFAACLMPPCHTYGHREWDCILQGAPQQSVR